MYDKRCVPNSCQNQNFTKMKIHFCYGCRDKSTIHLVHRGIFIINSTSIKCCVFKKPHIGSRLASNLAHFKHLSTQKDTAKSLENAFKRFFF